MEKPARGYVSKSSKQVEPYMPKDKASLSDGGWYTGQYHRRRFIAAWTCSTALCQAEMHATAICLPGRVSSNIIRMQNMSWMISPIDAECDCPVCQRHFSRVIYPSSAQKQMKCWACALRVMHNLYFYNTLMEKIRAALDEGRYEQFRAEMIPLLGRRI